MKIIKSKYEEKNGIFQLRDCIATPIGKILITLRNVKTGHIVEQLVPNMFVTAGKVSVTAHIRGDTSNNKGIITYCALGTSTVAPALADTQLAAEIFRKLVSVRSNTSNVATFQTFYTTSEGNGTLREAGLFGDDASGTVNTGTLYCRSSINRVKTSAETLTLSWAVTIA